MRPLHKAGLLQRAGLYHNSSSGKACRKLQESTWIQCQKKAHFDGIWMQTDQHWSVCSALG